MSPLLPRREPAGDGAPGRGRCRRAKGSDGAGERRWLVRRPVGQLRAAFGRAGPPKGEFQPVLCGLASAPGAGEGAEASHPRAGAGSVLSRGRNPLWELKLDQSRLIKSCESVLLLPGALSHAMFDLLLPRF